MSPHVSTFENTGGLLPQMIVRVVPAGSPTGKRLELVHEGDEPLIEFWDPRYPREELEDGSTGQLVAAVPLARIEMHVGGDYVLDRGVPACRLTEAGYDNAMTAVAEPVSRMVALRAFRGEDTEVIRAVVLDLMRHMTAKSGVPEDDALSVRARENLRTKTITAEHAAEMVAITAIRSDRVRPVISLLIDRHRPSPVPEI